MGRNICSDKNLMKLAKNFQKLIYNTCTVKLHYFELDGTFYLNLQDI